MSWKTKDGISADKKILVGSEQLAEFEWAFGEDAQKSDGKIGY